MNEEQTQFNREITKLFKKWIVRRDGGNCQILFALTELDDFIEDIEKKHLKALSTQLEEIIAMVEKLQPMALQYHPDKKDLHYFLDKDDLLNQLSLMKGKK